MPGRHSADARSDASTVEASARAATTAGRRIRQRALAQNAAFGKCRALPSAAVATAPDPSLDLELLSGEARPLSDWLTMFPLVLAVIDPYTHESAWLLGTIRRIFETFRGADCRVAWLVTADREGAEQFLGPLADEFLTYIDPHRALVKSLELSVLPALVILRLDCSLLGVAEGWNPETWRPLAEELAQLASWSKPTIPAKGDPVAYPGTPALAS